MKKFNTILAIAAIALTSVFGFTSCDKNNDSFNNIPEPGPKTTTVETPAPAPVEQADLYFYVPATGEQLKYVDATYTLSVDGQTKVIKLSEMAETKDADRLAQTSKLLLSKYNESPADVKISEAKIFEYHIGKVKDVKVVSTKYTTSTAKTDHWIDAFSGSAVLTAQGVGVNPIRVDYLSQFDDLASVFDLLSDK